MLIGYGRVSTAAQNPAHQADALARAGVAARDIHIGTVSGRKRPAPSSTLCCSFCARATPW
jgi:DNA invertase Pin-like site-specific DNA recombinase